jgi:hypothetical protein
MDPVYYYRSLTQELDALKGRVRYLIEDQHWQTDGEWKESVLRAVLRRHLPPTVGVGRGFIVGPRAPSTQIDVLLYNTSYPLLHQDGDLVFVTADAVVGIIEVKATLYRAKAEEALEKLADKAEMLPEGAKRIFLGLFAFEHEGDGNNHKYLFKALQGAARGHRRRAINHIAIGASCFVRFWRNDPYTNAVSNTWRRYDVDQMARGYFLMNALESAVGDAVRQNLWAWFPRDGKEIHFVEDAPLKPILEPG